jgi:hypothetical protein
MRNYRPRQFFDCPDRGAFLPHPRKRGSEVKIAKQRQLKLERVCYKNSLTIQDVMKTTSSSLLQNGAKIFFCNRTGDSEGDIMEVGFDSVEYPIRGEAI